MLPSIKTFFSVAGTQIALGLIGLFTGRLISRNVNPSDFGLYNIQFAYCTFFYSLLLAPLVTAYKTYHNEDNFFSVFSYFLKKYSFLLVAFVLSIGVGLFVKVLEINISLFLIIITTIFSQIIFLGISDHLNITGHFKQFNRIKVLQSSLYLLLLFIFLTMVKLRTSSGLWLGLIISQTIVIIPFFRKTKKGISPSFEFVDVKEFNKKILKFIKPLMVLSIFSWVVSFFDKYLLAILISKEASGLYSASYNIGSKFLLLSTPFLLVLTPKVFKSAADGRSEENVDSYVYKSILTYIICSLPALLFTFYFKDWIGNILLSSMYKNSFSIIPIICGAYFIYGIIYLFETKFYAFGYTKFILYHNVLGAVTNITLNLLLVNKFGFAGAAYAMLITLFIQCVLALFLFKSMKFSEHG